eukprot:TRINITY_DN4729_c0_g1_i2.p1 TRINITY_DN4729_c0_g1~~TRINITY_DN4729_c0_g1_i2.p1  ORF type:complete len:238 (-),score=30.29 TRINITY_DN4729_c0_g1_i2:485-1198(-)
MKKFDPSTDLYDMKTYKGRVLHFIKFVSPTNLFCTKKDFKEIEAIMELVKDARSQGLSEIRKDDQVLQIVPERTSNLDSFKFTNQQGETKVFGNKDMWNLHYKLISNGHPQTKELVPFLLRWSAFVPVNIPIAIGMACLPQTTPIMITSQIINQTYNFSVNIAYRDPTNKFTMGEQAGAYLLAVSTAVGASLLMKSLFRRIPAKGAAALFLDKFAPYVGVVSASCANLFASRYKDIT